MQLIYTHPNSMMVGVMANALEQRGIETETRNDILGGAAGEIAPGETWIELWIFDETRAEEAKGCIQDIQALQEEAEWACMGCKASNPANFELCWQCQTSR